MKYKACECRSSRVCFWTVTVIEDHVVWHSICKQCAGYAGWSVANDRPLQVTIEVRAAELAMFGLLSRPMTADEVAGWEAGHHRRDLSREAPVPYCAGWLAHAIANHDEEQLRERVAAELEETRRAIAVLGYEEQMPCG